MQNRKKVCIAIITLFVLWLIIGATDYIRVHSFEKPVFCIGTDTADDGGSGHYAGLGYSFEIDGNFMPEDELPGVTEYSYKIFGVHVESRVRD